MGGILIGIATLREHGAPLGERRLGAKTKEGQRGGVEDRRAKAEGGDHEQWGEAVGEDMHGQDPGVGGAQRDGRGDIVAS